MAQINQFLRALVGTTLASTAWLLLQAGKCLADAARRLECDTRRSR